jgi:hypothetical protein
MTRRFKICASNQILCGCSGEEERNVRVMWYVWATGFWWGHLMEINHFKDLVVDGRMVLN